MVPAIEPVTIKLYGNQRLHRPNAARYVTRAKLPGLVRDAETGTDIAHSIPAQGTSE